MGYTTPVTWVAGTVVSATDMNAQLRDNMGYVHSGKPVSATLHNENSTYSTTSATFVDVDATDLSKSITTTTGRVQVAVTCVAYSDTAVGRIASFDVDMDGTRIGSANADGLCRLSLSDTDSRIVSFVAMKTGVSNGSHTFKLQWKISTGTAYLFSGTANTPVVFQVMEW